VHTMEVRNKKSKSEDATADINLKIGMVIPKRRRPTNVQRGKATSSSQQQTSDAEYLVDDSYDSILRSVNVARTARDTHAETLNLLDAQGEQLRRIQEKTDEIDGFQDQNDRHIRSIKSLGGYVGNKFIPASHGQNRLKKADRKVEKHQKEIDKNRQKQDKEKGKHSFGLASDDSDDDKDIILGSKGSDPTARKHRGEVGFADLYRGDGAVQLSEEHVDKMKKTDEALDELGDIIHDLHVQSIQASDALEEHNVRLDYIDKSVNRANNRLRQQNAKIK